MQTMQAMKPDALSITTDVPKATNSPNLKHDPWTVSGWIRTPETTGIILHYSLPIYTSAEEITAEIRAFEKYWKRHSNPHTSTGTAEVLLWQRLAALLPTQTKSYRVINAASTVPPYQDSMADFRIGDFYIDVKVRQTRSVSTELTTRFVTRSIHLESVHWMKTKTGLSYERIAKLIGVSRQTLNRWERGERIADVNRRRVLGVRDVLERASLRYATSEELVTWLDTPYGIGGRTAADLLEEGDINRARLFAIATPSTRVVPAPSWVGQPIPVAFQVGAERMQEALPPETEVEPDDELSDNDPATQY